MAQMVALIMIMMNLRLGMEAGGGFVSSRHSDLL